MRQHGPGDPQRAKGVHLPGRAEHVDGGIEHGGAPAVAHDARAVHERLHPAVEAPELLPESRDRLVVGDVGRHRKPLDREPRDGIAHSIPVAVARHHREAALGKLPGNLAADAAARSGHNSGAAQS